jgi:hypothetical protein
VKCGCEVRCEIRLRDLRSVRLWSCSKVCTSAAHITNSCENSKELILMDNEDVHNRAEGVMNLSKDYGQLGTLWVTNLRIAWAALLQDNYNCSVPFLQVQCCSVTCAASGCWATLNHARNCNHFATGYNRMLHPVPVHGLCAPWLAQLCWLINMVAAVERQQNSGDCHKAVQSAAGKRCSAYPSHASACFTCSQERPVGP